MSRNEYNGFYKTKKNSRYIREYQIYTKDENGIYHECRVWIIVSSKMSYKLGPWLGNFEVINWFMYDLDRYMDKEFRRMNLVHLTKSSRTKTDRNIKERILEDYKKHEKDSERSEDDIPYTNIIISLERFDTETNRGCLEMITDGEKNAFYKLVLKWAGNLLPPKRVLKLRRRYRWK